ncbi:MAG TPA: hypothetical protein VG407_00550 [Caulobacteraceae bacterium]|jgi:hypothetical protein|nr:hypothetical protein [Caulobacteraceae bacterium]
MTDSAATSPNEAETADASRLFSPMIAFWMIIVGVFAFAGFFVLQAYAPDLRSGNDGGGHALSQSAIGYAGLVDLLKARGDPVIVSRGPVHASADAPGLLILTPSDATDPEKLAKIKFAGDALIVLPKWQVMPDVRHLGWVRKIGPLPPEMVAHVLPEGFDPKAMRVIRTNGVTSPLLTGAAQPFDQDRALAVGATESFQTIAAKGVTPLIVDANGGVVLGVLTPTQQNPYGASAAANEASDAASNSADASDNNSNDASTNNDAAAPPDNAAPPPATPGVTTTGKPVTQIGGQVYVLSDPDLLDTHGLKDLQTARTGLAVIDGLHDGGPIAMDVTLHGFSRGRSILKLAFEPPFLALTLCLLAAAAMMGWHAYVRFGPAVVPERAVAFGKAALVDNSSALIRVARREPRMGKRYVGVVRAIVATLVGAPRDLDKAELDRFLDRVGAGKQTDLKIETLAEESADLRNNTDLMRLAQRLHRWRTEMTRERR